MNIHHSRRDSTPANEPADDEERKKEGRAE
jgi:hypothetical protein